MRRIVLFLFFTYIGLLLRGQKNEAGYIIQKDGDSVNVLINWKNWDRNPISISYKLNDSSEVQSANANEITGFGNASTHYLSVKTQYERSPHRSDEMFKTNFLSYTRDFHVVDTTIFLKRLFDGTLKLYSFKDTKSKELYYVLNEQEFILLLYRKFIEHDDFNDQFRSINKFRGQLSFLMQDCPDVKKMIAKSEYRKNDILKVMQAYSICRDGGLEARKNLDFDLLPGSWYFLHEGEYFEMHINDNLVLLHNRNSGSRINTYQRFKDNLQILYDDQILEEYVVRDLDASFALIDLQSRIVRLRRLPVQVDLRLMEDRSNSYYKGFLKDFEERADLAGQN